MTLHFLRKFTELEYEVVGAEIVVAVLRRRLDDFLKFRDAVLEHLRS